MCNATAQSAWCSKSNGDRAFLQTRVEFRHEERMPGEPLKTLVVLESDDGRMCQFEVADEWLVNQGIEEGDEWPEDIDKADQLAEQIAIQNACMDSYFESLSQLEEF